MDARRNCPNGKKYYATIAFDYSAGEATVQANCAIPRTVPVAMRFSVLGFGKDLFLKMEPRLRFHCVILHAPGLVNDKR